MASTNGAFSPPTQISSLDSAATSTLSKRKRDESDEAETRINGSAYSKTEKTTRLPEDSQSSIRDLIDVLKMYVPL